MIGLEDLESYLIRIELDYEEIGEGIWAVHPSAGEEEQLPAILVNHAPPVIVLRSDVQRAPEDEEEQCVGPDAAVVAAWMHGAFYSPEAQARLNPVKIDLVRLTNEQHRQSVADLVGSFVGRAPKFKGGGLKVNDTTVADDKVQLTAADLVEDGVIKLSLGKKKHVLLKPA